jgi:hypothetical protein
MDTDFLDWALADFSGYVAADELYDGPFCILSAVDNRRYQRLLYDVLDHDPTHEDIRVFLGRLKTALVARGLTLCGVITDGSALYPAPLKEVFGQVRHQICQFHIVAEVVKAVVGAVASARKALAATQPKLPKGRPSTPAAKAAARTKKRLTAQGAALFASRHLFVQRHLNKTERKTLWRVSRGLPQLQALRAIMEQVYPTFKGVWYAAVNFALLPLRDTRPDQCLRPRRRADDGPGFHGPGGLSYSPQQIAPALPGQRGRRPRPLWA